MDCLYWSINRLVRGFIDNDIQLLETQRKYAWGKEQVRELIDSIYKGYPSGSILLWETDGPPRVRGAAASKGPGRPASGPPHLLLDGHQRLASLAAVLAGIPAKTGGGQAEARPVEIYFDMGHPERPAAKDMEEGRRMGGEECKQWLGRADYPIFRLKSRGAEGGKEWIPVTKLFKEDVASVIAEKNIGPTNPNYGKYLERLNRLRNTGDAYLYPVQIIGKDVTYEEVADILVRLGHRGQAWQGRSRASASDRKTARRNGLFSDAVR